MDSSPGTYLSPQKSPKAAILCGLERTKFMIPLQAFTEPIHNELIKMGLSDRYWPVFARV